jgi:alpha-galactosidase
MNLKPRTGIFLTWFEMATLRRVGARGLHSAKPPLCRPGPLTRRSASQVSGLAGFIMLLAFGLAGRALAVHPSAAEFGLRTAWRQNHLATNLTAWPFSFVYQGRPAAAGLAAWKRETTSQAVGPGRLDQSLTLTDPATGLRVRCEVTEYLDHSALEWVLHFENRGPQETPLLEAVRSLEVAVPSATNGATMHYARGALCSFDDFQPLGEILKLGTRLQVQAGGGRSSSDFLPFFNLENPSRGVVVGVGWSGEWSAEFSAETPGQTRLRAGQALTRLTLRPGEQIRTPRIALLFYEGDWVRGQNLWRRFVLDQHRPKVAGQPLELPLFNGNWGGTSAELHLANIRAIAQHNLSADFYWIDAEWFGDGPWFVNPGNWQVKKQLYPDGFKPLSDALHESGRKLLLWFEPERVCEGTTWDRELGRWLLTVPPGRRVYRWDKQTFPDWVKSESLRNQIRENDKLFDLGNPQARQFLTDFISDRIREWGLDCYRHDANIAPLEFWRAADAPSRQGLTEIRWVEGLYAFWDELLRRHPHLIIDNCASGGRRIDLETLSRSVPLWRTDFPGDPIARQCHTYGLSFWVPLNGTGGVNPAQDSDYAFRSSLSSTLAFGLFGNGDAPQAQPPPKDFPFARAGAALTQCRRLQRYFLGDYYPLTAYSKARDTWLAWQFDLPDKGEGMVQAFRRDQCIYESARLKLPGLDPSSRYVITNLDSGDAQTLTGRELLENGLPVAIKEKPGSALITYAKAK